MKNSNFIPSVNYHLWEPCNMRCKFCFATFQDVKKQILPKGHLPKNKAIELINLLGKYGFEKITFAGGESTLCPWLPELIEVAKAHKMTTMLVTNGTKLTDVYLQKLQQNLDWIALSIDSLSDEVNQHSGRAVTGKKVLTESDYLELIHKIKTFSFGFKINTVVHALNYKEDMTHFINNVKPKRWKVLQVLPVRGQNTNKVDPFLISSVRFKKYVNRHREIDVLVPEYNNDIKGSYVMIDPAGRFFDNVDSDYKYSKKILDVGVVDAYHQMRYCNNKFKNRGGVYDWQ